LTFGFLIARGTAECFENFPGVANNRGNLMKTFEETRNELTGSDEAWRDSSGTEKQLSFTSNNSRSDRTQIIMQKGDGEISWRGFPEYDSPLAG